MKVELLNLKQYELEEKINDLLVQRSQLLEHIDNLKRARQDYCMCGMRLDTHGSCGNNHASISEFDWYIEEHNAYMRTIEELEKS